MENKKNMPFGIAGADKAIKNIDKAQGKQEKEAEERDKQLYEFFVAKLELTFPELSSQLKNLVSVPNQHFDYIPEEVLDSNPIGDTFIYYRDGEESQKIELGPMESIREVIERIGNPEKVVITVGPHNISGTAKLYIYKHSNS
jgi:hypothetical protein